MNKELIRKLYFTAQDNCSKSGTDDAWTFELEFTRLIVSECVNVITKLEDNMTPTEDVGFDSGWILGLDDSKDKIVALFGV